MYIKWEMPDPNQQVELFRVYRKLITWSANAKGVSAHEKQNILTSQPV